MSSQNKLNAINISWPAKLFFSAAVLAIFLLSLFWMEPANTVLLILLACLAFSAFLNPKLGLFFLIIIRPSLDILTEYPVVALKNFSLNLSSLLAILTLVFAVFVLIKNFQKIKTIPLKIPVLIFIFIALVSSFFSPDIISGLTEWARLVSIFSLYILGFILIASQKELTQFTKAVIFSAAVPSIFAFYQFFTKTEITISTEEIYNRIFGTFAHPNLLAYFLVIILAILIFEILRNFKQGAPNILYPLSFLCFTILLILTYTRGAWLAFLITIFIIGVVKYRKLLIFSILFVLLLYAAIEPIRLRVDNLITSDPASSVQWRLGLWKDSVGYIGESLILGHGTGVANELILENRGYQFGSPDPHNDYLKIALENGLLGLLAYLLIVIALLFNLFKKYIRTRDPLIKNLILIMLSVSVALYIMSFADNILRNTALQWAYWVLIGAIFAVTSSKNNLSHSGAHS